MIYSTLIITEMSQKVISINWYDTKDYNIFSNTNKLGRDSIIDKQFKLHESIVKK